MCARLVTRAICHRMIQMTQGRKVKLYEDTFRSMRQACMFLVFNICPYIYEYIIKIYLFEYKTVQDKIFIISNNASDINKLTNSQYNKIR